MFVHGDVRLKKLILFYPVGFFIGSWIVPIRIFWLRREKNLLAVKFYIDIFFFGVLSDSFGWYECTVRLGVDFINILRTPIFLRQKITKPKRY